MFQESWFDELKREYEIQDSEYSEYLRLELRKRAIEKELEEIGHQQKYIGGKIKSIWSRDKKRNHKFGSSTFFLKDNIVVNPSVAVGDEEVVGALEESGFDELVDKCVDYKGLRDLVRKSEGQLPDELKGLLTVWTKSDLYIRLSKEKNNDK